MFGSDPPWNWVSTRYRHPARLNKQTLTTIDMALQAGLSGPGEPKNKEVHYENKFTKLLSFCIN